MQNALAVALYGVVSAFRSEIQVEGHDVSFFWPASGLAVAIIARLGATPIPFLFAINWFALNRVVHNAPATGIAAAGLVLEAMTAVWLFRDVLKGDTRLPGRGDLIKFLGACVGTAPIVGATIGTLSWCAFGLVEWERAQTSGLCWWYGESIGILFAGAFLLGGYNRFSAAIRVRPAEAAIIGVATVAAAYAVFYASPDVSPVLRAPLAILPLPFLYWGATRIGIPFTAVMLTILGGILASGTRAGFGPFGTVHSANGMVVLWAYGHICGITSLLMGALLAERDRALDALRATESRYRDLVETGPSVVYAFMHDNVMKFTYVSPQIIDLLGVTPEECYAEEGLFGRMIHPEDFATVAEQVRDAWQRCARMRLEYRVIRRDGTVRWIRDEAAFTPARGDAPAYWQGMIVDITERREAQVRLQQSEARLASIIHTASDAMVSVDDSQIITMFNPAAEAAFGYTAEEAIGKPLDLLLPEESVAIHANHIAAFARESAADRPVGESRCVFGRRKSGEVFPAEASISKTEIDGKKLFTAILRDISQRLREEEQRQSLEAQLRQAQKIEAVGQLAGGVAHDFNNLLQVVQGFTRLAMERQISAEQRTQYLNSVCEAADKATALTSQLLAFGRRQSLERADCDLDVLVQEHLKMIRRLIGEHIQVEFTPGHQLGNVRVDRSQIEQVMLNLCLNARDAMPGGGRLHIELGNVLIDSNFRESHPWAREGRYVLLTVTDSGCGMPPETQARIFEPFFTTKPLGRGTGLGLSVVHGIIQQHEGLIHVYSEPDVGTTFKVYFPIVERKASNVGVFSGPATTRSAGTILLAEDEAGVREIAIKLLERAGYCVYAAENGEAAVALFRHHAEEIDVLMFDVVMPRLGGFDAYKEIARIKPGIPTLFCSGFSGTALSQNGEVPPGTQFLHKPYSYDQLRQKLAELHARESAE